MLDLLPTFPEGSSHKMPMDFSPYLLSASPPALGFDLMSYSNSQHAHNRLCTDQLNFENANNSAHLPYQTPKYGDNLNERRRKKFPLKSIIIKADSSCSSDSEGEYSSTPSSPGKVSKKVTFADHKGLALAQVRLVKESPDEPPNLSADILSALTLGSEADITDKPPITLCFPQPASDYLAFRDKICRNLVCLENVILRDYTVEGTIKVKNITFEKRVFVRLSLDDWLTHQDFEGTYVPGPGLGYSDPYDTFSFTMDISPSFDINKKVQFAVCFEENGKQHWDNNGGSNYSIVSEHFDHHKPPAPTGPVFHERYLPEKRTDSWADFSVWRDTGAGGTYY